eukprot:scaffold4607_cov39-Cyclotella_meneghiniana.AAC.6
MAYFDDSLVQTYTEILGPVQDGVGIKNVISITAFGDQAALDAEKLSTFLSHQDMLQWVMAQG